jgi:hypothetical protein
MTQPPQQPYPGGPQGPQGPQYYGPPPKKKHRFRNFVVFPFLAFIILIVIIVAASGGGGGSDPGAATDDATTKVTDEVPEDRGQPRAVTVGKAFTIGKHQFDAGWKLQHDEYLGSKLVGSVTNVSKDTSTAFFHVKFLKGNSVLGNFQCSTNDLEPGQKQQVECLNMVTTTKKVAGYDKVTAEATF